MKILLTGHKGFIGTTLFKKLQSNLSYKVIGLDIKDGNDLLTCDLPKVDVVIHLAGLSGVRQSFDNPTEYWKQNVIVSQRLFDHYKDKRIMYASSSTAYEPWRNPYALSKCAIEHIAPIKSLGMRFTTAYGPNGREQMLIPKIIRNDVPYINTNHSRDFLHVDDLVRAIDSLINSNVRGITDIGSGRTNNLIELVDYFKIDCERVVGNKFERLDNLADNTLLNNLGWSPQINLYDYIKENKNDN
jgi:nucleoside-diphosphate-sugar epimerase